MNGTLSKIAAKTAAELMLAAVLGEPAQAMEKHRPFLALGQEVASGANRWKESTPR